MLPTRVWRISKLPFLRQYLNISCYKIRIIKPKIRGGSKMSKKGFVSMHPIAFLVVGILIGAAVMYYLMIKGIVPGI